jgi:ABC-2 type transport system ATP-binding protein
VTAAAISTTALRKHYGPRAALDGVDLQVPSGSVYGLVGPNGAGKTTLLAILAGLRRPSGGGVRLDADRRRVGMLPDTPSFDPWLTGREVVDLARALVAPAAPAARVDQVLADAGLADAAGRRVGGYSRGMLQRLGLAATVVGDPQVLLLDEPCSALDPAGRREVLDLVARLSGQVTVLLSTHILSDVEEVCDTVGVLRAGRLLYQGPLDELLVGRVAPTWTVRCRPPLEPVEAALARRSWVTRVERTGAEELLVEAASREAAEAGLAGAIAEAGARLVRLEPQAADLERVFLELTR